LVFTVILSQCFHILGDEYKTQEYQQLGGFERQHSGSLTQNGMLIGKKVTCQLERKTWEHDHDDDDHHHHHSTSRIVGQNHQKHGISQEKI
jgi:hypothetical protein